MTGQDPRLRERILDEALALAAVDSWESVRLHAVAAKLGVPLDSVRLEFAEKEDLVDAFFDRADASMLAQSEAPLMATLEPRQRLQALMMAWFEPLTPHRRVVREMIGGKLEPGHLHVQIPGLLRVSRTVQWLREAAGLDATFLRRAAEETILTGIYLATFARWMRDDSEGSTATADFLERCLRPAEQAALSLGAWGRAMAGAAEVWPPATGAADERQHAERKQDGART